MLVTDLRTGNYVKDDSGRLCVVSTINENGTIRLNAVDKSYIYESFHITRLQAITITEGILVNSGFKEFYSSPYRKRFDLIEDEKFGYDFVLKGSFSRGFRFIGNTFDTSDLHIIQNLYYFLSNGEELNIKL